MKKTIEAILKGILEQEKENFLDPSLAGKEGGEPIPVFDLPLVGIGDAEDPLFEQLRRPEIVGEHVCLPTDMLPEARSVVSVFFPLSEEVRRSNREGTDPAMLWLNASKQLKIVSKIISAKLVEELAALGVKAVVPSEYEGFKAVIGRGVGLGPVIGSGVDKDPKWADKRFTSNWSERHVAFICGLGTFGVSGALITEKGVEGSLLSLVMDREAEITPRKYTDPYEYCIKCGACVRRCPAKAISMETGYSPEPCMAREDALMERFAPYQGCGKCRVGVPCEFRNPSAK